MYPLDELGFFRGGRDLGEGVWEGLLSTIDWRDVWGRCGMHFVWWELKFGEALCDVVGDVSDQGPFVVVSEEANAIVFGASSVNFYVPFGLDGIDEVLEVGLTEYFYA